MQLQIEEEVSLLMKRASVTIPRGDYQAFLAFSSESEEVIKINVGGQRFETTMETLLRKGNSFNKSPKRRKYLI